MKAVEYTASLGWTVLPHPSYCLDLASSDLHLLGLVKDELPGEHSPSKEALTAAVKLWIPSTGAEFYECGMRALVHHR